MDRSERPREAKAASGNEKVKASDGTSRGPSSESGKEVRDLPWMSECLSWTESAKVISRHPKMVAVIRKW